MWTACIALAASWGCKASPFAKDMDISDAIPWVSDESQYSEPESMIIMWTDAVYKQAGAKPVRGFGGRIYFYDKNSNPIAVDGQLTVYGYDDDAPSQNDEPHRKFVFTREQFTQHYSETDLGASYSVWLPWEALGGPQRRISLFPIFSSASGKLLRGEVQSSILPGKTVLTDEQRRGFYVPEGRAPNHVLEPADRSIRQIHYEGPLADAPRRNTEFTIPRRMADRMRARTDAQKQATQNRADAMLKELAEKRAAVQRQVNGQELSARQASGQGYSAQPRQLGGQQPRQMTAPGVQPQLPQQHQATPASPAGGPGVNDRFRRNSLSSANFTGVAAGRAAQEAIPRPQFGSRFSPGPPPARTGPTVRANPSLVPTTQYR
jgi:hypothetical protein